MPTLLKGIPASPGIAIGKAAVWTGPAPGTRNRPFAGIEEELARLSAAVERSKAQLRDIRDRAAVRIGKSESDLFHSHLLMLDDPVLMDPVREGIRSDSLCAEEAVDRAVALLAGKFEAMQNEYLRQRAADVREAGGRLIRNLSGQPSGEVEMRGAGVICARSLSASETSQLDAARAVGIVTAEGGATSHAAILARALGIPSVAGVASLLAETRDGDDVIVDGSAGEVLLRPGEEALELYRRRAAEESRARAGRTADDGPAITRDGVRIEVLANISCVAEADAALAAGAEGVGVLRSEFLFFHREAPPSGEEQFEAYREVLSRMAPRRVVVRTLDAGGDKVLPGWQGAPEENPELGLRGIRLCLRNEALFGCQLAALMRAAAFGNLAIMLPMVSTLEEVRRSKEIIARAGGGVRVPLGVMIETPAAALMAEELAEEVDFFSIGVNDLTQYTLAADRGNRQVAHLYQPFHPAVLRLIQRAADAAIRRGKRVAVCGEMAAHPLAAPLLAGLGIRELSVSVPFIGAVKASIRRVNLGEAGELAEAALKLGTAEEVMRRLGGARE